MKYTNLSQSGFSLVETLVAISILLIVIIGPLTISTSTARSTSFASEQVVAFFLAQEGAEIAQKARDDILLADFTTLNDRKDAWGTFSNDTTGPYADCFASDGCGLYLNTDSEGSVEKVGCSGDACKLYLGDTGRARYTHVSTSNNTVYTRVIKFTPEGTAGVKVESMVTWRTGSQRATQEVVVDTYLYNVYGN